MLVSPSYKQSSIFKYGKELWMLTRFKQMLNIKHLVNAVTEFEALKVEINKARCVLELDGNGNITHVNKNFTKATGYHLTSLHNKHHRILLSRAESTSHDYQAFWQDLQSGKSQSGTFKIHGDQGQTVWMIGYYAPVKHPNQPLMKVVAYLTDVTEDKNKTINLEAEDKGINSVMGIVDLAPNTEILEVNEIFSSALGYQPHEMIGRKITDFMRDEDKHNSEFESKWEELKNGTVLSRQIRRVAKNGKLNYFHANYFPVLDQAGKVSKVESYVIPINDTIKTGLEHQSQINAIDKSLAVIEFDLNGNVLKINNNFSQVMGYTSNEIVGKHHKQLVPDEIKNSSDYQQFWHELSQGKYQEGIFKRLTKEGKEVWLQATYNPIFDLNGEPYKVVKFASDVTIQKNLALDNQNQFNAINRSLGIIEFNLDGTIRLVNDNFAQVTGYSPQELIGKHHSVLVPAKIKQSREYQQFWQDLNQGEFRAGEFEREGKHGKNIWLNASYNPIMDESGKPYKVVKFAADITPQKQAEFALSHAVEEVKTLIDGAKNGDLSVRLSLVDKEGDISVLCESVNALVDNITEVISQVKESTETIATAASQIASGNSNLSQLTEDQASSLEKTAAKMEELTTTVKHNSQNAMHASQLAMSASEVAGKGGAAVSEVVNTMNAINDSAKQIEEIISVIDGIAFQTNILALNAAVEAARAGEQGRGFAVVAGEVRTLAQRSASAAKEIKELITDSVNKTKEGTMQVENAGATMTEIVSSVKSVTDIIAEITSASIAQTSGLELIHDSITSVDEATQQNAALVEEAAAAAESLFDQANQLTHLVSLFRLRSAHLKRKSAEASVTKVNTKTNSNASQESLAA